MGRNWKKYGKERFVLRISLTCKKKYGWSSREPKRINAALITDIKYIGYNTLEIETEGVCNPYKGTKEKITFTKRIKDLNIEETAELLDWVENAYKKANS